MIMTFLKKLAPAALLAVLVFSSCATTVNIPENLSPAEIIQRAQEASDRNRYNIALQYYQALHERNRNNVDLMITAEYEMSFIQYKRKNYQQAREGFNAVLAYYDSPDQELLPQHFKRLSQIVLERIDELESGKKR